jgi:hypothetical protein
MFHSLIKTLFHKKTFVLSDMGQDINDIKMNMDSNDRNTSEIYTDPESCLYHIIKNGNRYSRGYVVSSDDKKKTAEITMKFIKQDAPKIDVRYINHM